MSTERIFLQAMKVAESLAAHDDLGMGGDDSVFTRETVEEFKAMEAAAHEAELLLNELDNELEALLGGMNEDTDGGMFLCKEAVPIFDRVIAIRSELHALAERLASTDQSG